MKDDSIELPPLPSPGEAMSKWAYDEFDMQSYARAAIEADRQRRGEPVYQVNMKGNGWEDCTLDRYESAGRVIEQDAQRGWKRWERRVLWSAPQPAEPVKVPSDLDSKHVQDFINCDGMGAMIVEGPQYSAVVRALLARYGQQATPQEPLSSD